MENPIQSGLNHRNDCVSHMRFRGREALDVVKGSMMPSSILVPSGLVFFSAILSMLAFFSDYSFNKIFAVVPVISIKHNIQKYREIDLFSFFFLREKTPILESSRQNSLAPLQAAPLLIHHWLRGSRFSPELGRGPPVQEGRDLNTQDFVCMKEVRN